MIWALCDGRQCLGEIAGILHRNFPHAGHGLDVSLVDSLRRLSDAGLLTLKAPDPKPPNGPVHELCILFLYHKPDMVTRRHLDLLTYFNPNAVVIPLSVNTTEKLPGPQATVDVSQFESRWDLSDPWRSCDAAFYTWFTNRKVDAHRYLWMEYDCYCTMPVSEAYREVWNADIAARAYENLVTRPDWHWFREVERLDNADRSFAAGVTPLAGILLSHDAFEAIAGTATRRDVFCELRVGTTANRLGLEPRTFSGAPLESVGWHERPLDYSRPGVFHPVKMIMDRGAVEPIRPRASGPGATETVSR